VHPPLERPQQDAVLCEFPLQEQKQCQTANATEFYCSCDSCEERGVNRTTVDESRHGTEFWKIFMKIGSTLRDYALWRRVATSRALHRDAGGTQILLST